MPNAKKMSPGDLAVKACECVLQYNFTFHITNPKHLVPVVHRIASTTNQIKSLSISRAQYLPVLQSHLSTIATWGQREETTVERRPLVEV